MNENYRKAFKELLYILKAVPQEDLDRIPAGMMQVFTENADPDYECHFDFSLQLKDWDLMTETKGLLSMLYLECWCKTEDEKQEFTKILSENSEKHKLAQYEMLLEEEEE